MRSDYRPAAFVLLVVLASGIVALAASGVGMRFPPLATGAGWLRIVRLAGLAAVVVGLAALLVQRRAFRGEEGGSDPTVSALLTAALIMGVLTGVSFLAPAHVGQTGEGAVSSAADRRSVEEGGTRDSNAPPTETGPGIGGMGLGLVRESPGERTQDAGAPAEDAGWFAGSPLQRIGRIVLLALLFVATVAIVKGFWRRPGEADDIDQASRVSPEEAAAGLEASLIEIADAGGDPRRQITVAYHRLLNALSLAGARRAPYEAPHEHLSRALGPLGVKPAPMHLLTDLYVAAQFSERRITEADRAAATDALERALASLRTRPDSAVVTESVS